MSTGRNMRNLHNFLRPVWDNFITNNRYAWVAILRKHTWAYLPVLPGCPITGAVDITC